MGVFFMPRLTELPAKSGGRKARDLYSGLNVLRTGSKAEFSELLLEISRHIEPKNPIDKMYVSDIAHHTWDIMLYRRIINGIMNNALRTALTHVLNQILLPPSSRMACERWAASELLSWEWLFDQESKRRVSSLLQEAGFDESAIEAEAYRLVADDLEKANRMLKAAQDGRDKALRSIAKYRRSLADQLQRNSDRVLAADEVPSLANDAAD
jgi:hypothetical protein